MPETSFVPDQAVGGHGRPSGRRIAEAWAASPSCGPRRTRPTLAPGRARRMALDDALEEMEAGRRAASPDWKVRYALMLGLERVVDSPPRLASGTELRRHQIDALAGMLAEPIASARGRAENGNGNGKRPRATAGGRGRAGDQEDDEEDDELAVDRPGRRAALPLPPPDRLRQDDRRGGFVEAARTMGVLILTHRRLLVSQFTRDLTTEGYGDRFAPRSRTGHEPLRGNPITIQTYAWFARHVGSLSRSAYQLVICDEAHTALGEKTSAAIRRFTEPIYIGMTATEQLIAKQVSDVFPASVDDLPPRRRRPARADRAAPLPARPARRRHLSVPIVGGDYDQEALARSSTTS